MHYSVRILFVYDLNSVKVFILDDLGMCYYF